MSEPGDAFRRFSARCGADRLRVQGPGGNTSIKTGETMWIKASGTELADAEDKPIFVAVDRAAARAEALGAGDGTCKATVIDKSHGLRPSIETTFHALIDWPVVAHTHSIATLVHAVSPDGLKAAGDKLTDLPTAFIPYRKPGLPLTRAIAELMTRDTQVFVLGNHGLIVAGDTVDDVAVLMDDVEARLAMPRLVEYGAPGTPPPAGHDWVEEATCLARDVRLSNIAMSGSLYPDHVVFLGPGLANAPDEGRPAHLAQGAGVAVRTDATSAQRAMVLCLADVLSRLPPDWSVSAIGPDAEAELLDWDAEKYRQALAGRAT